MTSDTPTPAQEAHVEALGQRLARSPLSWGTHADRWNDTEWQTKFWQEVASVVLASDPLAAFVAERQAEALREWVDGPLADSASQGRERADRIGGGRGGADVDPNCDAPCQCGHGLELHDSEAYPYLCLICGDNTRCNYATPEEIAADRWDEGFIAAVAALTPPSLEPKMRLLWVVEHMPTGNPYRTDAVGGASC